MGARRTSKRRRRRPPNAAAADTSATPPSEDRGAGDADPDAGGGAGRAALLLALLLGALIERVAASVLPAEALDVSHLAIAIGVAFLVARWYRGFMRRTLGRSRAGRQRSRTTDD